MRNLRPLKNRRLVGAYVLAIGLALLGLCFFPSHLNAQEKKISKPDQERIKKLVDCVLKTQLSDGAIPAVGYRFEGQPVHIDPYFVNLSMLGLCASDGPLPDPRIGSCVKNWLNWCSVNQNEDGTFSRYDGILLAASRTIGNTQTIAPDSHDSYAAGYLSVVEACHYRRGQENLSPALLQSCMQAFQVLERCKDPGNGFYWNFDPQQVPDGKVLSQYMLDNIEVMQGLQAAQVIFTKSNEMELAELAQQRAVELQNSLHKFYHPQNEYFGCMYGDVVRDVPWGTQVARSERLATVSALGFLDNVPVTKRETLWGKLMQTHGKALNASFSQPNFTDEDPTIERVYFASLRGASGQEQKRLLGLVRKRIDQILKIEKQLDIPGQQGRSFPFVHRYGMLIQALLINADQQPAELPNIKVEFEAP